ncbi:hypothetical protein KSX_57570 [Ktedonospora formicarum]|uniref:Uncharacterized protein n=1 Tax=Ktedonospora formicarum TaxID=2778364 RepID=A0A8J3I1H2_9CHLR|nr:hypothetical protein KSX_57570 [Ktedonospora formicarum]
MQNQTIIGENHSITRYEGASIMTTRGAGSNLEQLSGEPPKSKGEGLREMELKEVLPYLAFYAG